MGGCVHIISSFPAIMETIGERAGGEGGKERGSPGYGGERGEGVGYHIVGNFPDFCSQTLARKNFFLLKFLADNKLRKSSTLSSSCRSSN